MPGTLARLTSQTSDPSKEKGSFVRIWEDMTTLNSVFAILSTSHP